MSVYFTVISQNTEAACRPGFYEYLSSKVNFYQPDVIALQEVHLTYGQGMNLPERIMPVDPGKRIYPIEVHQFHKLKRLFKEAYFCYFAPHMGGLHDYDPTPLNVLYGQALFLKRTTWRMLTYNTNFIFGQFDQLNTEKIGGTPAGKAAQSALLEHVETGSQVAIINVHGFTSQQGKVDIPHRFVQNVGISNHLSQVISKTHPAPYKLLVGDLNYRSDKMTALEHLRTQPVFGRDSEVLNERFGVTQTRTAFYRDWQTEPQADYMVACSKMAERAVYFKAELDALSDHALLRARFWLD